MADIAEESSAAYDETQACFVCCEDFSSERPVAFGTCNHRGVCALCLYRLRKLVGDKSCPFCKQEMDQVVCCDAGEEKTFEDFGLWGDIAPSGTVFDEESRIFFPKKYFDAHIAPLEQFICWVPGCRRGGKPFQDRTQLRIHHQKEHNLAHCRICLTHKKAFLAEQPLFSPEGLRLHMKKGDPAIGFEGHPRCEFCKRNFYDSTALFQHLSREHFSCHICKSTFPDRPTRYFRDYSALESHFRREHFLCPDAGCLAKNAGGSAPLARRAHQDTPQAPEKLKPRPTVSRCQTWK